jgi:hypothetical protein
MVIKDETSLYNLTDGKTKAVKQFLENLNENSLWTVKAKEHFKKQLVKANDCISMDEALDIVGYRPDGICELIVNCGKMI